MEILPKRGSRTVCYTWLPPPLPTPVNFKKSGNPCRGQNAFEKTLADLNVSELPKSGSRAVCCNWLALRSEVIHMLELKQQVAKQAGRNTPGSSADGRKRPPKNKVRSPFWASHTASRQNRLWQRRGRL